MLKTIFRMIFLSGWEKRKAEERRIKSEKFLAETKMKIQAFENMLRSQKSEQLLMDRARRYDIRKEAVDI